MPWGTTTEQPLKGLEQAGRVRDSCDAAQEETNRLGVQGTHSEGHRQTTCYSFVETVQQLVVALALCDGGPVCVRREAGCEVCVCVCKHEQRVCAKMGIAWELQ
jgi:hypothetical protein